MPADDTIRRRHVLLVDVTQAASDVSRLVHEARDLNLPIEPGVRDGRDALVRWAVPPRRTHPLSQPPTANRLPMRPRHPAGPFRFHKELPRLGEVVPLAVEFRRRSMLDQAASSLVGVTAAMVWSSVARSAGRWG